VPLGLSTWLLLFFRDLEEDALTGVCNLIFIHLALLNNLTGVKTSDDDGAHLQVSIN
jgi:hypothetical protein